MPSLVAFGKRWTTFEAEEPHSMQTSQSASRNCLGDDHEALESRYQPSSSRSGPAVNLGVGEGRFWTRQASRATCGVGTVQ